MIYLAMHKKGGKNAHGVFVTLTNFLQLDDLIKDFEKRNHCPHQGMFMDARTVYSIPDIKEGIAYVKDSMRPSAITLLAEPDVNNKTIKRATAFLKSEYEGCRVSLMRLLPLRNWYPTHPVRMCENQKLKGHTKNAA